MVEVTNSNFEYLFEILETCIKNSTFIAFDSEFTGLLSQVSTKDSLFDNGPARYAKKRKDVSQFTMMQLGLSIFTKVENENQYEAHTFNFYLYPRSFGSTDVKFLCQASSLEFLCKYNFDFNKFVYGGISYLNEEQEQLLRKNIEEGSHSTGENSNYDEWQMQDLNSKVSEWLATAKDDDKLTLIKPLYVSDYTIHLVLRECFPNVWTRSKDKMSIECEKVAEAKRAAIEEENKLEKERIVSDMLGFTRVFRLLVKYKKPLIGHNCFLDLMLMHDKFYHPLPDSYKKFKENVNALFPFVFDTKHISANFRKPYKDTGLFDHTGLQNLHLAFAEYMKIGAVLFCPSIKHAHNHVQYSESSPIHEAGFDAFMAGCIFIRMAHLEAMKDMDPMLHIARPLRFVQHFEAVKPYMNRINLIRASINDINLAGDDPPSIRPQYLFVQTRVFSQLLKPSQLAGLFSRYGSVDILPRNRRQALVAVNNWRCAKDILRAFRSHESIKVSNYSILRHSSFARSLMWTGALFTGTLCAWVLWSAASRKAES